MLILRAFSAGPRGSERRSGIGRPYLDTSAVLDRLHNRGDVLLRPDLVAGELQEGGNGLAYLDRDTERLGLGDEQIHVLHHQSRRESLIELARDDDLRKFLL